MPWKAPAALIAVTLALTCGARWHRAYDTKLEIEMPDVISVSAQPQGRPGQPSSLYIVRISWSWLALADDEAGYGRVTLGAMATPGTILDLYPHELHAPSSVGGELSVDAQQRLKVVPKGPGTIPIAPSIERLHGRRHGSWVYWSVAAPPREVLAPGHASAYVLLQVPPGQAHAELRLRSRAQVGSVRFGNLRSVCHAQAEERAFSLSLPVPTTASSVDAGHAKWPEPR